MLTGDSAKRGSYVADARAFLVALAGRRLAREGAWIMAGHAASVVASIVSVRLFTELVPQSVFGGANLLIGIITLGMNVLVAPFTQTQVRYQTNYLQTGNGDRYTWLIGQYSASAAIVIIAVVGVGLIVWPQLRAGAGIALIGWLSVWTAALTAKGVLIGRLNAERRQRQYALWVAGEAVGLLVFIGGILTIWPTVEGYIAGQTLGIAFAMALFGWFPRKPAELPADQRKSFRTEVWNQVMTYGVPFAPFFLLGWIANLADRYILASKIDAASVGIYVAAFAIASKPAMLIGGALTDLFRPAIFAAQNSGSAANAQRYYRVWIATQAACSAAIVAVFFFAGNLVARLLLAEPYREGVVPIMCWSATAYGILAIGLALENRIFSLERSRSLISAKFAAAVGGVALAFLLIPRFGSAGAAMANTGGQLAYVFICVVILRQLLRAADPVNCEVHP